jgi:hypothetical protein
MADEFYTPSGSPSTGAQGESSTMRAEFAAIQAGFDKMPTMGGNGLKVIRVNAGGSALEAVAVTGTGSAVMNTSPALVTPNIGAASGASLSVTGQFASTVATGTPPLSVASTTLVPNLYSARAALADAVTTNANLTGPITSVGNATSVASQTGAGNKFVMDTSPTLVTPVLGVATVTSLNKVSVTQPATSATLTIDDGKTLRASASLTFTGADGTTHAFPSTSSSLARTDAAQTFTGAQAMSNLVATGGSINGTPVGGTTPAAGKFTRVVEVPNTYAPTAGAGVTVDWTNGGSTLTNSGTNVLTFSNVPAGVAGHVLYCTNFNNTTFPAAVDWGVGGKSSIAGAALVSLTTFDGGATIKGSVMWEAV